MDDITDRLRNHVTYSYVPNAVRACMEQAIAEIEHLRAEAIEQARIIGMGAERELALQAQLDAQDRDIADWLRQQARDCEKEQDCFHEWQPEWLYLREQIETFETAADAIERRDYRKGKGDA